MHIVEFFFSKMDNSFLCYPDSLLGDYLTDSKDTLPLDRTQLTGIPQISVESVDHEITFLHTPANELLLINRPVSVVSLASSYNSLYSSISDGDLDLQSVELQTLQTSPKRTRLNRLKRIIKKPEAQKPMDDDSKFFRSVCSKLQSQHYAYEKTTTLNVKWEEAAETFFFGDTLDAIFTPQALLHYLMQSSLELGEVRFLNLSRFHENIPQYDMDKLMETLEPALQRFNGILDLYAESQANIKRPELFELFSGFANHSDGLCIPLAIAMFGNWLLSYNRDTAVASNYQNTLILNYLRKAARLALVVRKLAPLFEHYETLSLRKFWGKDNRNALALSMQGLAEYYQFVLDHNTAVTLWEMNCHLTDDVESGNLAILGLTNGYGFGNHVKEHSGLGKRSKTDKFNTKRRVAHLYRILMKRPDFNEYGVSWATKEKYD